MPMVLLGQMPQRAEVQVASDDWTGQTDPAERRKRQNRLHQRTLRKFCYFARIMNAARCLQWIYSLLLLDSFVMSHSARANPRVL